MRLTPRQKTYIEALIYLGWKEAQRISGFSNTQLKRIKASDEAAEYRMQVIKDYLDRSDRDIDSLIASYEALAKDPKTSPMLKERVLSKLIEWYKGEDSSPPMGRPQLPGREVRMLEAKETWSSDKEEGHE